MTSYSSERFNQGVSAWLLALSLAFTATPAAADGEVYKDLGGIRGIEHLTTAVLDRVYADQRIAFLFQDTDRDYLHDRVAEQICVETGGPCEYKGLSMERVHGGLDIRHSEFDAFVEDFILGMEDAGIPYRTQNRVLKIFAPMREDIVDK